MCSLHANNAADAVRKLSTLPLLAGRNIDAAFVVPTVAASVDVVVHAELQRSGRRRIVEIATPTGEVEHGAIGMTPVFELSEGRLEPTGRVPAKAAKFARAGIDPAVILLGAA